MARPAFSPGAPAAPQRRSPSQLDPHCSGPSSASAASSSLFLLALTRPRCRSRKCSALTCLPPQSLFYPLIVVLALLAGLGEPGSVRAEAASGHAQDSHRTTARGWHARGSGPELGVRQEPGRTRVQGSAAEGGLGLRGGEQGVPAWRSHRQRHALRADKAARNPVMRSLKAAAPAQSLCSRLPAYDSNGKVLLDKDGKPLVLQDWSSWADTSYFLAGPCLVVSAIHLAQTPLKTVVAIDRRNQSGYGGSAPSNSDTKFPAEELNLATGTQRGLTIIKNAFCSTGTLLSDGSLASIGGAGVGKNFLRRFRPCKDGSCDFESLGVMKGKRWYPSSQLLSDGRVMIVGGSLWGGAINTPSGNNPTIEYWPPGPEGLVKFPFLVRTLPFNHYPILHLLPSGLIFIFAGQVYTLFNATSNKEVPREGGHPALRVNDEKGRPIFRCSPSSAASALLPLSPADGYKAEVIICGGARGTFRLSGKILDETSDDMCWSIFPDADTQKPKWVGDRMCYDYPTCNSPAPRVMGQAVLLADGSMLLLSGATKGFAGYNNHGPPNLKPLLYFPSSRTWYTTPLATSHVPRLYHSTATLLHDATVLVAGSGPSGANNVRKLYYPDEFRTEIFYPPYLQAGPSPSLTSAPSSIPINSLFSICFKSARSGAKTSHFKFALSFPGFSTHGLQQGMRHINLEIVKIASQGRGAFGATLKSPLNLNVAPPTSYWLFVLEQGVPSRGGNALKITPQGDAGAPGNTFSFSKCKKAK